LDRRLGGPQSLSGRGGVKKNSHLPGLEHRITFIKLSFSMKNCCTKYKLLTEFAVLTNNVIEITVTNLKEFVTAIKETASLLTGLDSSLKSYLQFSYVASSIVYTHKCTLSDMPTHLYFRDTEFSLPSELLDVTH
jgi:hypothetical protein